jgi:hypothetical protein
MGLLIIVNFFKIRNNLDVYAKCNFLLVVTLVDNSYDKHSYTQIMKQNRG